VVEQMMKPASLTVPEMAADLHVCREKVRRWCESGAIEGAVQVGDGNRKFWRAPREAFETFKSRRRVATRAAVTAERRAVSRSRVTTNLLGL
jgi:plasmid maintenance system antidote protein VapI